MKVGYAMVIDISIRQIYGEIDKCKECQELAVPDNTSKLRCNFPHNDASQILIVSQNPSIVDKNDPHVWGGLDRFFKNDPELKDLVKTVWITNIIKCRTKKNVTPTGSQINNCQKWLDNEIIIINPKIIITLGNIAAMWFVRNKFGTPIYPFPHPYDRTLTRKRITDYINKLKELLQPTSLS
jgi:uracil-DNA glycosylase family 4